jgi:hypothetical protein
MGVALELELRNGCSVRLVLEAHLLEASTVTSEPTVTTSHHTSVSSMQTRTRIEEADATCTRLACTGIAGHIAGVCSLPVCGFRSRVQSVTPASLLGPSQRLTRLIHTMARVLSHLGVLAHSAMSIAARPSPCRRSQRSAPRATSSLITCRHDRYRRHSPDCRQC